MARNGAKYFNPDTRMVVKVVANYVGRSTTMVEYLANGTIFTSAADTFLCDFVPVY